MQSMMLIAKLLRCRNEYCFSTLKSNKKTHISFPTLDYIEQFDIAFKPIWEKPKNFHIRTCHCYCKQTNSATFSRLIYYRVLHTRRRLLNRSRGYVLISCGNGSYSGWQLHTTTYLYTYKHSESEIRAAVARKKIWNKRNAELGTES